MVKMIRAILCIILSALSLIISVRSFKEKGFLFNNAYIWASKQERESMDKKPYYRQSAIVFALITLLFLFMAVECVLQTGWLWIAIDVIAIAALVYAVASSMKRITK